MLCSTKNHHYYREEVCPIEGHTFMDFFFETLWYSCLHYYRRQWFSFKPWQRIEKILVSTWQIARKPDPSLHEIISVLYPPTGELEWKEGEWMPVLDYLIRYCNLPIRCHKMKNDPSNATSLIVHEHYKITKKKDTIYWTEVIQTFQKLYARIPFDRVL